MSEAKKNYPTRMHEVLGVETGEIFTINEDDYGFYHTLDCDGQIVFTDPEDEKEYRVTADMVTSAINHGIIRKPRLSEEQVKQLRALVTLGFRWLTMNSVDELWITVTKPNKYGLGWGATDESDMRLTTTSKTLGSLVSWSDPEPLDIVATLKAAGVEVEG